MFQVSRTWYKHGWTVFGLVLSGAVIFGLGLFLWQTYLYYQQIKIGNGVGEFMPITEAQASEDGKITFEEMERRRMKELVSGKKGDPFAGPVDAKHEIVEFMDYGCPYCQLAMTTVKDLINLRPDIKVTLRDYPVLSLHPQALDAAKAARCIWLQGNEAVFWKYHDLLFAEQEKHDLDSLRQYARTVGGDAVKYNDCMLKHEPNTFLADSIMEGEQAGVYGTPTFFVDGKKLQGAHDMDTLVKFLSQ